MRAQSVNFETIARWVGRIFRFDFTAFDEIRSEPTAATAAVLIVLVASLFAGLGSWLWALQHSFIDHNDVLIRSFLVGSIVQTAGWFLWVYMTYQILARGYGARVNIGELMRTMGFAFAPVALNVLVLLGGFAVPIGLASFLMAALITNIAIQRVSDADVGEATLANLVGFAAFAIFMGIFANILEADSIGGLAPGILFFSLDL